MTEDLFAHKDFPGTSTLGQHVLVIGACPENQHQACTILESAGFVVHEAHSNGEALMKASQLRIDLVLLDTGASEINGPALCSVFRAYHRMRSVPVLFLIDQEQSGAEEKAIRAGADGVLARPLTAAAVRASLEHPATNKPNRNPADEAESALLSLAEAIEARDSTTGQHCQRVALMCSVLGVSLSLSPEELVTLQRGAFLHDIGKIAVPDKILLKAGPLSAGEWSVMKDHTKRGEQICWGMDSLSAVLPVIRSHHERWDGTGYPDKLAGDEIPLLARIIQVADVFDALTTARTYKHAFTSEEALHEIRTEAYRGWRDPRIVEAFCDLLPAFTVAEDASSSSLLALSAALGTTRRPPSHARNRLAAEHAGKTS